MDCRAYNVMAMVEIPYSIPLPLSGYQMWGFPLDRYHIREYVKHPMVKNGWSLSVS
jgi:hypothetical protein